MNILNKKELISEIIDNNFDISYEIEYPALFRFLLEMEELKNNYKSPADEWFETLTINDIDIDYIEDEYFISETEERTKENERITELYDDILTKDEQEEDDDILKLNIFNYVLYKHFNIEKKFIYSTFSNNDIKTNYILSNMSISDISKILEQYKNYVDTKDEMKIFNKLKEYVEYNKKQK